MKLIGLMPVRNEEWILRLSAEVALRWVDHLVILDHASDDGTVQILQELLKSHPRKMSLLRRPDPTWAEMEHRQALLEEGRFVGGTHFALIDADELLTASALGAGRASSASGAARREIEALAPGECLDVPMLPIWNDLEHVRADDCVWTRAWLTLAFADHQGLHWEARPDGYEHHHRAPFGAIQPAVRVSNWEPGWQGRLKRPSEMVRRHLGGAGVMHLQFANRPRLIAKHALYKMQEVLRWPGRETVGTVDAKYSQALDEEGLVRAPCPPGWWKGYDKTLIDLKGVPWQISETKRLLELHGEEAFKGLNLWERAE